MKVQKTSTKPAFQPIELKITIETQEEVDMLKELCEYERRIPYALSDIEGISREQANLFADMLTGIRQSL